MFDAALPAGPRGLPLLGTLFAMWRDPLRWLQALGHVGGPLSSTRVVHIPVYMVNDPALIEEVLVGRHRECTKTRAARELASMIGNGLLTAEGEHWRKHRRLAAPALQPKRITTHVETMLACTQRAFAAIGSDDPRNVDVDMARLSLEIAAEALLGFDVRDDATRVARILEAAGAHFTAQLLSFWQAIPAQVPTAVRKRYKAAMAELDAILYGVVRRTRAQAQPADHLLARLIHARGDHGESLSDLEIRDEAAASAEKASNARSACEGNP